MDTIHYRIKGKVLHIIFPPSKGATWPQRHSQFVYDQMHPDQVYKNPIVCYDVKRASARYEGENTFVGFNFPTSIIRKEDIFLYSILEKDPSLLYVITYMKGDIHTMNHEKRHALYYINPDYKKRVRKSWTALRKSNPKKFNAIRNKLLNDGYQTKVLVDEFQAYHPHLIK